MEQPRLRVEEVSTADLLPYAGNAKIHTDKQVGEIAASIEQFGFSDPIGVWTRPDGLLEIVEGHGRLLAAERLGIERVPVVRLDHLDDDGRRAYTHVHNQTTLTSGFDWDKLNADMGQLQGFDWSAFGFNASADWFTRENRWDDSREEGNEEYNEWLDKFDQPKTTDDCYTPDNVYEVVASFVAETYGVERSAMVRPFYPGGNYQAEKYAPGAVVVDNPPFSIVTEIVNWYNANGVRFFLFAPGLTIFGANRKACAVVSGKGIIYENGADVPTSFLTNLEDNLAHTYPQLTAALEKANRENMDKLRTELPKYSYPPNVLSGAMLSYIAAHGQELIIGPRSGVRIQALDAQKEQGKGIFGGGLLLSEKAAAEKAAAEKAAAEKAAAEKAAAEKAAATRWPLSERELETIRGLE